MDGLGMRDASGWLTARSSDTAQSQRFIQAEAASESA